MTRKPQPPQQETAVTAASSQLLGEVRSLFEQSRRQLASVVNSTLTSLYWHIGQRVRTEVLKQERAAYGEQIVSALARQLELEYGRGFSAKNLRHMLRFAEAFPDAQIVSAMRRQLTWTHFRTLIYIDDPLKRDFYLQMCRPERRRRLTPHRHSREACPRLRSGGGNPDANTQYETTRRLHPRQSTQGHTLRRSHQRLGQKDLGAQKRISRRIRQEIPGTSSGLFRAASNYGERNHPGKTTEEMESRLENRTDREEQPTLARPLAGYRRIGCLRPCPCRTTSFPRKACPRLERERESISTHLNLAPWIPACAGMTWMGGALASVSVTLSGLHLTLRRSRENGSPVLHARRPAWIPAFAGMTASETPREVAGIHDAEYPTDLPPKDVLQAKLREAISRSHVALKTTESVIPAKLVPDSDRGAGIQCPDGASLNVLLRHAYLFRYSNERGNPASGAHQHICSGERA